MSMQLIQTVTVGAGGASSISFTSIPQDGTDLLLYLSMRGTVNFARQTIDVKLNGSSAGTRRFLTGTNLAASSFGGSASEAVAAIDANAAASTSNTFSSTSFYLSNYTTITEKSVSVDNAVEENGTSIYQLRITAASYTSTAAVTTLTVTTPEGTNIIAQHSSVSLYKITKGSDGSTVVS